MLEIKSSDESSSSSFDGELIIQKSKKKLMTIPKGKASKLEKSKAIKKDKKKEKKEKKEKKVKKKK